MMCITDTPLSIALTPKYIHYWSRIVAPAVADAAAAAAPAVVVAVVAVPVGNWKTT